MSHYARSQNKLDKERERLIVDMYVKENKSVKRISNELGHGVTLVHKVLSKYNY